MYCSPSFTTVPGQELASGFGASPCCAEGFAGWLRASWWGGRGEVGWGSSSCAKKGWTDWLSFIVWDISIQNLTKLTKMIQAKLLIIWKWKKKLMSHKIMSLFILLARHLLHSHHPLHCQFLLARHLLHSHHPLHCQYQPVLPIDQQAFLMMTSSLFYHWEAQAHK